jgi:hypothetical protein
VTLAVSALREARQQARKNGVKPPRRRLTRPRKENHD